MIVDQLMPIVYILDPVLFHGVVSNNPLLPVTAQRLSTNPLLMQQQNYSTGFKNFQLKLVFTLLSPHYWINISLCESYFSCLDKAY